VSVRVFVQDADELEIPTIRSNASNEPLGPIVPIQAGGANKACRTDHGEDVRPAESSIRHSLDEVRENHDSIPRNTTLNRAKRTTTS
jgi:hypothetical protein